jgi:hypothetical protein
MLSFKGELRVSPARIHVIPIVWAHRSLAVNSDYFLFCPFGIILWVYCVNLWWLLLVRIDNETHKGYPIKLVR